jgi:hypothetical protein
LDEGKQTKKQRQNLKQNKKQNKNQTRRQTSKQNHFCFLLERYLFVLLAPVVLQTASERLSCTCSFGCSTGIKEVPLSQCDLSIPGEFS